MPPKDGKRTAGIGRVEAPGELGHRRVQGVPFSNGKSNCSGCGRGGGEVTSFIFKHSYVPTLLENEMVHTSMSMDTPRKTQRLDALHSSLSSVDK